MSLAIKLRTGSFTVKLFRLLALIAVVIWITWIVKVDRQNNLVDVSETCTYEITDGIDGLVPTIDGKRIGTFERYADGDVQLTLGNGFSPKANACIEKLGFGDRVSSIRKHD